MIGLPNSHTLHRAHAARFDRFGVGVQFGKLGKWGNHVLSRGLRE
jgi:hypothetical protein